jgi:predicted dithiol-disulfide oxidoreductase (DUF899 family)
MYDLHQHDADYYGVGQDPFPPDELLKDTDQLIAEHVKAHPWYHDDCSACTVIKDWLT